MGVMSRQVLPFCGKLCVCCPGLRSRSRQPVKRYKQLLADIFPKSQTELPNDRKIAKLIEYASKNPLRIPKIAKNLELRGYKALRYEHYGSVRIIMRTFDKLFASCTEQMPLFAISALNMIHVLLEQQNDDMRTLGCLTVVEFVNQQVDTTYIHNLDGFIRKFCSLAQETGPESRRRVLRASGLQALSAMLWFMGKFSHMPAQFFEMVAAVLDNYELSPAQSEGSDSEAGFSWETKSVNEEGPRISFSVDSLRLKHIDITREEREMPKVLSQVCVQNMACLGKEATTMRRVLESVFVYFDLAQSWSPDTGIALAVLRDMLSVMEKTGNDHLIVGALVRHLDHKNVADDLMMKTSIIRICTYLARHSKPKTTLSEIGIINDLCAHLRKSLQNSIQISESYGDKQQIELYESLQNAIQGCLRELTRRIGDAAPILEQMAVTLEKLSSSEIIARTTVEAMAVLAHVAILLPKAVSQGIPEALFYQLLHAMLHTDFHTRLGAHHILFVLLVPPSLGESTQTDSISTVVSTAFEKLRNGKQSTNTKDIEMESAKISGHQASLLLSNIWNQAILLENNPFCYEYIANTYMLALLLSRPKTSSNSTCVRAFQLAFTLRTLALDSDAVKSPLRRRSLFTLATAMLIIAASVYDVPAIIQLAKSPLTSETKDPFLEITEDYRLVCTTTNVNEYASAADENSALLSLSRLSIPSEASNEALVSLILTTAPTHLQLKESNAAGEMLQTFTPGDTFPLAPKRMESFAPGDSMCFDEGGEGEGEGVGDGEGDGDGEGEGGLPLLLIDAPIPATPLSKASVAMGVNQLLECALEAAAGHVACTTSPASPLPYATLAGQCEAFVTENRNNMSMVMKLDSTEQKGKWAQSVGSPIFSPPWCQTLKLPPATPYDNFLKAAGC